MAEIDEDQLLFDFDFFRLEREQKEKAEEEAIARLKHFEHPVNQKERLFNLQYDFYHGHKEAINDIFMELQEIASKLIRKEMKERKIKFTREHIDEVATDSTVLMIEQIIKNKLKITNSFVAYLYLQVRKVLYNRTKGELLEDYCIKHGINLFTCDDKTKEAIKNAMWENRKRG